MAAGMDARARRSLVSPWSETSAEKRQHEERVGAPAGGLLDLPAARQPRFRFWFVASLDGERGQALVAREQQLRLADGFRDLERAPVVGRARVVLAAALI